MKTFNDRQAKSLEVQAQLITKQHTQLNTAILQKEAEKEETLDSMALVSENENSTTLEYLHHQG